MRVVRVGRATKAAAVAVGVARVCWLRRCALSNWYEFAAAHAGATQTLLYASVLITIWRTEQYLGAWSARDKWRHSRTNLLLACSALPIQLFATVWIVATAAFMTQAHWGLVYAFPFAENVWLRTVALFFMLDACEYAYHRLMHAVPLLWRFHLVHHSDSEVDVSTTLREHPGESVFRNGMMIVWVLLCGASFEVLLLRQTVMSMANLTSHGRLLLPHRVAQRVQWLFVTPNFHRVHHHSVLPCTNSNYGDVFTLWDRLLGTYNRRPAREVHCGLNSHGQGVGTSEYFDVLMLPFRHVAPVSAAAEQADAVQAGALSAVTAEG